MGAQAPDGSETIIVATSEPRLAPVQLAGLTAGEIAAEGPGHAEVTALRTAMDLGLQPFEVAAGRPICPACALAIEAAGALAVSPLK